MKKTKISIVVTLIFVLVFLMTSCGSSEKTEDNAKDEVDTKEIESSDNEEKDANQEEKEKTEAEESDSNVAVEVVAKQREDKDNTEVLNLSNLSIESDVLFEKDNIKVSAVELTEDEYNGLGVNILVQNNSDKDIYISCPTLSVNDYMVGNLFSASVKAGQESSETIFFLNDFMLDSGLPINKVADIELQFVTIEESNSQILFETEPVQIKTSQFSEDAKEKYDGESVMFEKDGFKIAAMNLYEYEDGNCDNLLLYIENNSQKDVDVYSSALVVNDYIINPYYATRLPKGKMIIAPIDISEASQKAEKVVVGFEFNEYDSFESFLETGELNLVVK
ncbi:MAG: hypothetical protein CSB16_00020 [Clostridiales bacterium]|nr:MAG: hypothetical protein CSB16_00020 [Clostridiales bacterium]